MKIVKKIISSVPLYIILFPWYSILFLYNQNFSKLPVQNIIKPLIVTTLICLLLWGIFKLIFKNIRKAGVVVGILLLITFMFGPLRKLTYFNDFSIWKLEIGWNFVYLFFSLILFCLTVFFLIKSKRQLVRLNQIFNVGGVLLMISVVIPLFYDYSKTFLNATFYTDQTDNFSASTPPAANQNVSIKPDIYYIIPEDIGSPDILKEDYGYNNTELTDYLKARNFYIANLSKTNYPFSLFMITSALNMDYLNEKTLPKIKFQTGGTVISNALNNSKVVKFLKSEGYSFFYIGSWYAPLRYNQSADINFTFDNKLNLDEFSNTLLHNTVFYPLILRYFGLSGLSDQIANDLYQFQALANMPNQIGPKFVFVDLLLPHTPRAFNQNCEVAGYAKQEPKIDKFLPEVDCTNKKLIATIDTILKNSPNPPIIILQTDEGAKDSDNQALKYPNKTGVKGGFKNSSLETNLERTKILNAFYLPGKHSGLLYPEISPVNTFRLIFDEYFHANLPLLEDRVFSFDDYDKLYKLIFNDITDQVKNK